VRVLIPVGVGETGVLCRGAGEVGRVGGRGGSDGLGGVLGGQRGEAGVKRNSTSRDGRL
jgi:hypothetical protein